MLESATLKQQNPFSNYFGIHIMPPYLIDRVSHVNPPVFVTIKRWHDPAFDSVQDSMHSAGARLPPRFPSHPSRPWLNCWQNYNFFERTSFVVRTLISDVSFCLLAADRYFVAPNAGFSKRIKTIPILKCFQYISGLTDCFTSALRFLVYNQFRTFTNK